MSYLKGVRPELITLDIFGTVLDWRSGLEASCLAAGRPLSGDDFDRIVDRQAEIEAGEYQNYAQVTLLSLVDVLGMGSEAAAKIGANVGNFPSFPDASALRSLMDICPCAAMSNSDRAHGEQVQRNFGFRLSDWLCAEDVRLYKPNPGFWSAMAQRQGIQPGPHWWHVSAYADYDLAVAADFGLTTVFVPRPHSVKGSSIYTVNSLNDLLSCVSLLSL